MRRTKVRVIGVIEDIEKHEGRILGIRAGTVRKKCRSKKDIRDGLKVGK